MRFSPQRHRGTEVLLWCFLLLSETDGHAQRVPDYCSVPSTARPSLPATLMDGMGKSNFPITTISPEAQAFFNQGVSQLHAFWFSEAERSFMQAADLDPDAAMPYWGIAMSALGEYRPGYQLLLSPAIEASLVPAPGTGEARARDALSKALTLQSKATARERLYRERLYIEALRARHNPRSRDPHGDYIRGLRKLVAAYPDDLDARSILALALQNGYDPITNEPREGTVESLALLKEVLSGNPDHPAAHHFVIHGYEDNKRPEDAWESATRYPELVWNIPHALHMPGHIYAQSNRLEDAVRAFTAAASNELGYMRDDLLYPDDHYAHNQHFLAYVLGLLGRYREAIARSHELLSIKENPRQRASEDAPSAYRQGWFALMRILVRFEKWDEILNHETFLLYNKMPETVWYHWARGLAHASKGNTSAASASLREMQHALDRLKRVMDPIPHQLYVARAELEGYIDARSGKGKEGLAQLRRAARMEAELLYVEPSVYPRPVLELLGKTALVLRQFGEAESAYRQALEKEPGSGRALWGIAQALYGAGKKAEADKVFEEFTRAWATADTDLLESLRAAVPPR